MSDIYQQVARLQTARERRKTIRFLTYWERLKGLRDLPAESEIDPENIELLPFWDYCFIVQTDSLESRSPQYSHLGSAIIDGYREALCPDDPGNLVSPAVTKLMAAYRRVVETCAPYIDESQYMGNSGRLIKYRQCLVPLGKMGKVDSVLGLMSYLAMQRETH